MAGRTNRPADRSALELMMPLGDGIADIINSNCEEPFRPARQCDVGGPMIRKCWLVVVMVVLLVVVMVVLVVYK